MVRDSDRSAALRLLRSLLARVSRTKNSESRCVAVGSGQWAVGSGQGAVGSGQWAVGSSDSSSVLQPLCHPRFNVCLDYPCSSGTCFPV